MTTIRPEQSGDAGAIHRLTERAFAESEWGHSGEAQLVDRLRESCSEGVSLVAEIDDQVVGHILFTPAVIVNEGETVTGMGLAPMSVLPEHQRKGIGSQLVEAGLEAVGAAGCPFVIVLGHPEYYPRFGFEPASQHGVTSEWEGIPDEAFMILPLSEGTPGELGGIAKYRPEFGEMM